MRSASRSVRRYRDGWADCSVGADVIDLLAVLAIPFVVLAFLRHLSLQWFPWAMRPLERLLSQLCRAVWRLAWAVPVRQWGALNTLLGWFAVMVAVMTLGALTHPDAGLIGVVILWCLMYFAWAGLRAFHGWRLRPRRLPHRRRRDGGA